MVFFFLRDGSDERPSFPSPQYDRDAARPSRANVRPIRPARWERRYGSRGSHPAARRDFPMPWESRDRPRDGFVCVWDDLDDAWGRRPEPRDDFFFPWGSQVLGRRCLPKALERRYLQENGLYLPIRAGIGPQRPVQGFPARPDRKIDSITTRGWGRRRKDRRSVPFPATICGKV